MVVHLFLFEEASFATHLSLFKKKPVDILK
jgi:hypothetical protein